MKLLSVFVWCCILIQWHWLWDGFSLCLQTLYSIWFIYVIYTWYSLLLLNMLPKYCILFNALLLLPRRLYFHMPLFLGWFVSGITIQKAAMSEVQQSRNIVIFWRGNSLCFAVNPWSFLQATSLKRQHEDLTRPLVKPTTLSSCSSLHLPGAVAVILPPPTWTA